MNGDDELDAGVVGEAFCDVALVGAGVVLAEAVVVVGGVELAGGLEAVEGEPVAGEHLVVAPDVEEDGLNVAMGPLHVTSCFGDWLYTRAYMSTRDENRTEHEVRLKEARARMWRRQGKETRAQYDKSRAAASHEAQDAAVALHRQGLTRAAIVAAVRAQYPGFTEYQLKRILRVFRFDQAAFKVQLADDLLTWR
jgi:hypothetical protein